MALRIKKLRKDKGWTQDVLAAKAGLSRSQLAMIEAETRPANTVRLNAIAAALGVPPEDLFESDPRERQIVGILRRLPGEDADALLRIAEALAAKGQDGEPEDQ
ncbi:transcriptional regulator [Paracoccus kondratievae]|uniref:Transcriptional regulator n=2 Tax=Paracoccus kondratievae TaxID=135740 RepID=A0AAD3RT30_9RHOB|nr:CI-like repressor [Paracoccus phage vB_PkoS_Pkon1]GLK63497.1 transcriptional regulator [Paracoccus kondratievae]